MVTTLASSLIGTRLRPRSFDSVKALLGRLGDTSNAKLLKYMEDNKTETALAFFNAKERIKLPAYITEGLGWLDEQC